MEICFVFNVNRHPAAQDAADLPAYAAKQRKPHSVRTASPMPDFSRPGGQGNTVSRLGEASYGRSFHYCDQCQFDADEVQRVTERVLAEAGRLSGQPPAKLGQMSPTRALWQEEEDIRSLKSLILFGLRGMAAYAYHAFVLGYTDDLVSRFLCRGLAAVGSPLSAGELLPLVMETGKVNLSCMALLDRANTETYGSPVPTDVSMTIEKGPFIVVTGHDLRDLKLLLEQTEGRGINIYTHGEMLPAHGYPKLKAYPHLKGHFGTAWQNQQREFDHIPAPVLFTTNCLMPVRDSYRDRVFTAESVAYPAWSISERIKTFRL